MYYTKNVGAAALGIQVLFLFTLSSCVYGNCIEEDCVFTKWSDWAGCICSVCDESGETKQSCFRTRELVDHADGCHSECGETFESGCVGQCCNAFCAVTSWNKWSVCKCSGGEFSGRQFRNRTSVDGQCSVPCDIMNEERTCNDVCCPFDCQLGEWSDWSKCTVECATQVGYRTRERNMIQGSCGGYMCSMFDASEVVSCSGACVLSDWSTWNCTCEPCMGNSTVIYDHCVRTRTIPVNCNAKCGEPIEEICFEGECCDSDCELNNWSEWSECSAPCDSVDIGQQTRTRSHIVQCAGRPCQSLEESRFCNASCCAIHCSVEEWGEWAECTAHCESDTGTQIRTRHVNEGSCGGSICIDDDWYDIRSCQGACRLDTWSEWVCLCSPCDENDPDSLHRECSRRRNEIHSELCDGSCGSLAEYKCQGDCCDELCTVGEWSEWTLCDAPCGIDKKGNTTRTRQPSESCINVPCDSVLEKKECFTSHCCPENCIVLSWESWSSCSSDCSVNEGTRVRYRPFIQGFCNGTLCTEGDRFEIESCKGNCNISSWSEWSCDCQTCSKRNQSVLYNYCSRNRTVPASEECSFCNDYETICRDFDEECCNYSCIAEEWSTWTACTVGCESDVNGTQERTRQVSGSCTGRPCFDVFIQRQCGYECCLTNCTLGSWENWSVCSSGCSSIMGSQVRFRDIIQGSCGGQMCSETEAIDVRSCYGNCEVSSWSQWNCACSSCSSSNPSLHNDCLRTRTEIISNDCKGSDPCGSLYERTCSGNCCNELCNILPWSQWTECSAPCMTGTTGYEFRERSIDGICMSDPCETLFENRTCAALSCCPLNCTLGEWGNWSACSSLCNDEEGYRVRYRDYDQGYCGGKMCTDEHSYEVDICRGDCTLSPWSTWACMCELCNDGDAKLHESCVRERFHVVSDNCISTNICGALEEYGCFDVCCDEFCAVSEWEEWSNCSAPCGTDIIGEQTRKRTPIGLCQSDPCYNLTEIRSCLPGCCPVDCWMDEWSEWFSCSTSCQHVTGIQVRARDIEQSYCGGINCTLDDSYETRPCHGECVLSEWSSWNCTCSICDSKDINLHEECSRTRLEVNPEICNNACGELLEITCSNDACCDEYCELSQWSEWSECDATCGTNVTGFITRTKQPIAACFSNPCGAVYESKECLGPECCPTDCQMDEWGLWSTCSSSCSDKSGLTYRIRKIIQGSCGGDLCTEDAGIEISSCYGNCSLSEWTDWDCKCDFCDQNGILKHDCIRQRYEIEPAYCTNALCGSLVERVCSDECCDDFCILGEWSDWSSCILDCNTSNAALKERQREPLIWCLAPSCNLTIDTSVCNDSCCPVDCFLGNWNEWLPCSSKCSDSLGIQTRERSMLQGTCGGIICSVESPYETRVCYGDCEVGSWSEWECNCKYCNPTSQSMFKNCTRERAEILDDFCNDHCNTIEIKCTDACCDDSCLVHSWSDWTECTASCGMNGTSLQERFRNSSFDCVGLPCDELHETRICYSSECCPVNCTIGDWSQWTVCSAQCSGDYGMQHRVRELQNGSCGGTVCDPSENQIDRRSCTGECQVSEWSLWSCECGYCYGYNYSRLNCNRHRSIIDQGICLATTCNLEEIICGEVCCDEQCVLSEWSNWSNCSKSCDTLEPGTIFRERYIINECNTDPCDVMYEEEECYPTCCPQDCEIGSWSTWSQCSVLCYFEVGISYRTREIVKEICGGRSCDLNDTYVYQVEQCSGSCGFYEWSDWTCECVPCNTTSDNLYQNCTRTRNETSPDTCNGSCGYTIERKCMDQCCDPDCSLTDWSSWGSCSLECGVTGQGYQMRYRTVNNASCVADPCAPLIEKQSCFSECCPVNCSISSWSNWSNCSTHCSTEVGNKRRYRTIVHAECGGIECTDFKDEEIIECSGTCMLSDWSSWSCACFVCSQDDQLLHNMCTRFRDQSQECIDFESCGTLQEEYCGEECCDNFCFVGEWSTWTECSSPCDSETIGSQNRTRLQISQFCLGPPCDDMFETRLCNSACCPRDCMLLEWSEWSECSSDCSALNGTRSRTRDFIQEACGGITCDDALQDTDTCSGACVLSDWTSWSCQCNFCSSDDILLSEICSRQRTETNANCSGQCGDLTESTCGEECCDEFCYVNEWTEWSACNATCEEIINGIRVRTRERQSGFCLGKPCEEIDEYELCSIECCPTDCNAGEWSTWTECSTLCTLSTGIQLRTRNITEAKCGGICQINLNESEERNCTGDCQLSNWSSWRCSCVFCNPQLFTLYSLCQRTRTEHGVCNGECGELIEEECLEPCCDEFCSTNEWSSWSNCSNGVSIRNRNVISSFCVGDPCGGIMEEKICLDTCCMYTEWTAWTNCSTACAENVGTQSRIRFTDSSCENNVCNGTTEENRSCSGNCQPTAWTLWHCTCTFCNPDSQVLFNDCRRSRNDDIKVWCSGACGPIEQTNCSVECCDEFCFWSEWTNWSECQQNERTRTRSQSSTFCIGSPCGSPSDIEACITQTVGNLTQTIPEATTVNITTHSLIDQFSNICGSISWSTWSGCYSPCNDVIPYQYRNRQLVPRMCNISPCIESEEETRLCQGTFKSREKVEFDVHQKLAALHNASTENADTTISRFFSVLNMRERILIHDKHLAAFGYTLDEYLKNVSSSDTHACISMLLENAMESMVRLLHNLTSNTFDAESVLEIMITLTSQEISTVQESFLQEYNASIHSKIATSGNTTTLEILILSLFMGMRAETTVASASQIIEDVKLITEGTDVDVQSVLVIRSFEDIRRIYDEFASLHGDLIEFLASELEEVYTIGYIKIVEYARSSVDYWAAVIHRLVNVTPFPTRQLTQILAQRAEVIHVTVIIYI
ncbi:thrombospondin type-1 domain-containing protein 7A-like [Anneissia japonica]|uniref:thrombospondin type-1 domain-containing protein 7A-like n=1 Tax=Anneissia japonica TaxID=1529436 RepID=UPI0014257AEC|nr:thrombospondin type-1 domain-containing protein 7A-like [Anneissia japonica]